MPICSCIHVCKLPIRLFLLSSLLHHGHFLVFYQTSQLTIKCINKPDPLSFFGSLSRFSLENCLWNGPCIPELHSSWAEFVDTKYVRHLAWSLPLPVGKWPRGSPLPGSPLLPEPSTHIPGGLTLRVLQGCLSLDAFCLTLLVLYPSHQLLCCPCVPSLCHGHPRCPLPSRLPLTSCYNSCSLEGVEAACW